MRRENRHWETIHRTDSSRGQCHDTQKSNPKRAIIVRSMMDCNQCTLFVKTRGVTHASLPSTSHYLANMILKTRQSHRHIDERGRRNSGSSQTEPPDAHHLEGCIFIEIPLWTFLLLICWYWWNSEAIASDDHGWERVIWAMVKSIEVSVHIMELYTHPGSTAPTICEHKLEDLREGCYDHPSEIDALKSEKRHTSAGLSTEQAWQHRSKRAPTLSLHSCACKDHYRSAVLCFSARCGILYSSCWYVSSVQGRVRRVKRCTWSTLEN